MARGWKDRRVDKPGIKQVLATCQYLMKERVGERLAEEQHRQSVIDAIQQKFTISSRKATDIITEQIRLKLKRELETNSAKAASEIAYESAKDWEEDSPIGESKFKMLDRVEQEIRSAREDPEDFGSKLSEVKETRKGPPRLYMDKRGREVEIKDLHPTFEMAVSRCMVEVDSLKDKANVINANLDASRQLVHELYARIKAGDIPESLRILEKEPQLIRHRFSVVFDQDNE